MWVANFKLQDENDLYGPVCSRYGVDFFAVPYAHYERREGIHVIVGGLLEGEGVAQDRFISELKSDSRVQEMQCQSNYVVVHALHSHTRQQKAELALFYNPQYILVKPILVSKDGWEYWTVACLDRIELNKLVRAATKHYKGKLLSLEKENLIAAARLWGVGGVSHQQVETLKLALKEGYYTYPRATTIAKLAKIAGVSYSAFQERLRRAEARFLKSSLEAD